MASAPAKGHRHPCRNSAPRLAPDPDVMFDSRMGSKNRAACRFPFAADKKPRPRPGEAVGDTARQASLQDQRALSSRQALACFGSRAQLVQRM